MGGGITPTQYRLKQRGKVERGIDTKGRLPALWLMACARLPLGNRHDGSHSARVRSPNVLQL